MKYAQVLKVTRINGSVYGNPNYEFLLNEGGNESDAINGNNLEYVTRRTRADASDSYGIIPNEVRPGSVMCYEITRAGRVNRVHSVMNGAL